MLNVSIHANTTTTATRTLEKKRVKEQNDGSARALKLLAKQQRKLIEFKVLWRISAHDSEYFFPLYKLKAVAAGYVPRPG